MSKFTKKAVSAGLALTTAIWLSGAIMIVPVAGQTLTPAEIQAQINQAMALIQSLQAQLAAAQGTAAPAFNWTRNLTIGSVGEDVRALQAFLNAQNFRVAETGAGSPGQETTRFGPRTRDALARFQTARGISPAAGFFGPRTRAVIGAAAVTPGVPGVSAITAPMSVSLSADTPVAANVWRGSANNVVTRLTFRGGATATSVTGLTLRSYGTTEATGNVDITAVRIFDENNIQIGVDRTIAGNLASFVFVPAVVIPANGSRVLSVAVNVGTGAQVMAGIRLGVESAASVTGATFTGVFPIIGNALTIVPAGAVGTVSVAQFGTLPTTSVRIGERDVVLERFTISAGSNEDISITQIAVTNAAAATISDADISNLRIREVGGAVIAGPTTLTNRRATFNLVTPISLAKGTARNFEVIADIASGNARDIRLSLLAGAVVARGVASGISMVSAGATAAQTVTIGIGALAVSMAATHPMGAAALIVRSTSPRTLAAFDLRAAGENVILSTVTMRFDGAPTDINAATDGTRNRLISVGLYDGDALISDLRDVTGEGDVVFSTNWTIPAGASRTLTVRGITNLLHAGQDITLATTLQTFAGFGLASGETLAAPTAILATGITVFRTGDVTLAADTVLTPHSQGIRNPANNVTLAALRVFAVRENSRLRDLIITPSHTGRVSSLTLFASDGTQLSNPVIESGGLFTFRSADLLTNVDFRAGEHRTLLLRGNVIAAQHGFSLSVAALTDHFVATGIDSGTPISRNNVIFTMTSPHAGGTFNFAPRIVEARRSAASPAGTISRGSMITTGEWILTNADAALTESVISTIQFRSRTGLPTGLDSSTPGALADAALFRLFDGDGIEIPLAAGATGIQRFLDETTGTITFTGLDLRLLPGVPRTLRLVVDNTSTAKWPSAAHIHWTISTVGEAVVRGTAAHVALPGIGGTTPNIITTAGSATVTTSGAPTFPTELIGQILRSPAGREYLITARPTADTLTIGSVATVSETAAAASWNRFVVEVGFVGHGGTGFSIPADANIVILP